VLVEISRKILSYLGRTANRYKLMKTKLKSLFGHRGQILASLIVAFVALSLPLASRAQSGGPGTDHGVVMSIDDARLDIRDGSHTRTYTTTGQTQWLNKRGQRVDAGDVVQKKVAVKFRFATGGMEAMEVKIQ
jgi:hypothetical protein